MQYFRQQLTVGVSHDNKKRYGDLLQKLLQQPSRAFSHTNYQTYRRVLLMGWDQPWPPPPSQPGPCLPTQQFAKDKYNMCMGFNHNFSAVMNAMDASALIHGDQSTHLIPTSWLGQHSHIPGLLVCSQNIEFQYHETPELRVPYPGLRQMSILATWANFIMNVYAHRYS